MTGLTYYPDAPNEQHPSELPRWDASGKYICQQKIDGWRMILILHPEGPQFISRHDRNHTADIEDHIYEQAERLYEVFPERTQLDTEWASRRCKELGLRPQLYLHDILRFGKKWLRSTTYEDRWDLLQKHFNSLDVSLEDIKLIEEAPAGEFASYYQAQKSIPLSEGVVVKHRRSKMTSGRRGSKKNLQWFKVRYRGGSDGQYDMDDLRGNA